MRKLICLLLFPVALHAQTPQDRVLQALQSNRLPMAMIDGQPSGPGWDFLVREARGARFTLIGEEHGVAETAQLASALFNAARSAGYSRFAVEMSPILAQDVEAAARRRGYQGAVDFLSAPGVFTFHNLREESQFLADVVKAGPANERVLWGFDREVFSSRYLIAKMEPNVPAGAREAFRRLEGATDPALVAAVRAAWPNPDRESDMILRTLEESMAINVAASSGNWAYTQRRTQWNRDNMVALLRAEQARKVPAKVMMKFGYNHMIRGANYVGAFDIGAMADEVAALTGDRAFHVLVLPSPGSTQAVLGAQGFQSTATDTFDEFRAGDNRLTRVLSNPNATGHEVIDLRALRELAQRGLEGWNADLIKTIYGYDAVVVWKGAHASSKL
jgi:hypothetical protein